MSLNVKQSKSNYSLVIHILFKLLLILFERIMSMEFKLNYRIKIQINPDLMFNSKYSVHTLDILGIP